MTVAIYDLRTQRDEICTRRGSKPHFPGSKHASRAKIPGFPLIERDGMENAPLGRTAGSVLSVILVRHVLTVSAKRRGQHFLCKNLISTSSTSVLSLVPAGRAAAFLHYVCLLATFGAMCDR